MFDELSNVQKAQLLKDEGEENGAVELAKNMPSGESLNLIERLARHQRQPGESNQQAFDRFTSEDAFGVELLSAHLAKRRAEGYRPAASSFTKSAPVVPAAPIKSPALLELEQGAEQFARMAKLSPEVAFSKLCDTAWGAELLAKDKEQRGLLGGDNEGQDAMEQFTRLARQHANTTGQSISDSMDSVMRTKIGGALWIKAKGARRAAA